MVAHVLSTRLSRDIEFPYVGRRLRNSGNFARHFPPRKSPVSLSSLLHRENDFHRDFRPNDRDNRGTIISHAARVWLLVESRRKEDSLSIKRSNTGRIIYMLSCSIKFVKLRFLTLNSLSLSLSLSLLLSHSTTRITPNSRYTLESLGSKLEREEEPFLSVE